MSLTQVGTGEFSSSQVRLPAHLTFQVHGRDEVVITMILGGTAGIEHGQASHRYRLGDVYVASYPRAEFTCHTHQLLRSAARLLAATALTVFPNTAVTETAGRDRHDAHPATLQRAIGFIEANADIDITIADIARAAGVTTRAVQLAFRRHLDTTPAGYLRRVRLDQAHRQLQTADPDRDSVTAVAYRWGFSSPSRFAAYHRRAYGVRPSHTLRS